MRTTIDLPDDLHRILTSLARHTGRSLGQTVAELVRRGLEAPAATGVRDAATVYRVHPATGLPVVASRQPITEDDVRAFDDDPPGDNGRDDAPGAPA